MSLNLSPAANTLPDPPGPPQIVSDLAGVPPSQLLHFVNGRRGPNSADAKRACYLELIARREEIRRALGMGGGR